MILIMKVLYFLFKKDYSKIEQTNSICINVFCYKNDFTDPVYVSDQKILTKTFNRFMCNKTRCKTKKHFCKYCIQCFSSERVLIEHKENWLTINGKQTVKLKNGSINFKNHFK